MCWDDPVVDDPKLEGYNLPQVVDDFTTVLNQLVGLYEIVLFFKSFKKES